MKGSVITQFWSHRENAYQGMNMFEHHVSSDLMIRSQIDFTWEHLNTTFIVYLPIAHYVGGTQQLQRLKHPQSVRKTDAERKEETQLQI